MTGIIILTTFIFLGMLIALAFYLKAKMIKELVLAFLISLSWILYYGYNYSGTQLWLFGKINLFALVAWTLGLVLFAQLYEYLRDEEGRILAIIVSGGIYLIGINLIEWIGYNLLEIQLASTYSGLLGLNLMHGTWFLKAYYLSVWLLFIGLIELIEYAVDADKK